MSVGVLKGSLPAVDTLFLAAIESMQATVGAPSGRVPDCVDPKAVLSLHEVGSQLGSFMGIPERCSIRVLRGTLPTNVAGCCRIKKRRFRRSVDFEIVIERGLATDLEIAAGILAHELAHVGFHLRHPSGWVKGGLRQPRRSSAVLEQEEERATDLIVAAFGLGPLVIRAIERSGLRLGGFRLEVLRGLSEAAERIQRLRQAN